MILFSMEYIGLLVFTCMLLWHKIINGFPVLIVKFLFLDGPAWTLQIKATAFANEQKFGYFDWY